MSDSENKKAQSRRRIRKVLQLIEGFDGQPLVVGNLCAVSKLSERGLRRVFREYFGFEPDALLTVRLASSWASFVAPKLTELRELSEMLQAAVVAPIAATSKGLLIEAVAVPWLKLISMLERDSRLIYQLHWRKWEEIIAAGYDREGYDVELTPRSGDRGRDIIATRYDIGAIRIFDQVKAFSPDRLVTANDVRAVLGVLSAETNVSKAFMTTTSDFAPGVYKDPLLTQFMPYRLELRARDSLLAWLSRVAVLPSCPPALADPSR